MAANRISCKSQRVETMKRTPSIIRNKTAIIPLRLANKRPTNNTLHLKTLYMYGEK
ncbi:hypothetical protein CCACVL1_17097 [Corchorus capsularis]|uniref:Uncharacterized protein n=1 Tax=Corchorus capsularis TaxID=210143 RepID=A0A1R3HU40_COCAP|nr:hypothetical protein CCACVL1_17097 [Corchorus capsularis]